MNQYFELMVLSASPVELIRLLYRKAISSASNAREHLRNGRIAERCSAINNVYLVLGELTASLRPEESPELAQRLGKLYGYMQKRLIDANMSQSDQPLAEVLGLLNTLAEPWNSVSDNQAAPVPMPWSAGNSASSAPSAMQGDEQISYALSA
jgi:flagellar secretion chaperone FliS